MWFSCRSHVLQYLSLAIILSCFLTQAQKFPNLDLRQNKVIDESPGNFRGCSADLPNLSVGDQNLTQSNFEKFKKANNLFVLGLSDSGCPQCCTSEELLLSLQQDFSTSKYLNKKNKIKIARLDISKKYDFIEKEGIMTQSSPSMFVYFDGQYYIFEGNVQSKVEFLHFMNKIINPLITLKTDEDVQKFLNQNEEFQENTKFFDKNYLALGDVFKNRKTKTRVIAFIYDKEDYTDELKNLRQTGRFSAKRDELRIALVPDKKIIKKYKAKYGTLWFPEGTYSTIMLKRYDGQTFYSDLLGDGSGILSYQYWINKKSINLVEETNTDTFRVFEMIRQPILVAFVDMKSKDKKVFKESINLVDNVLKEVAPAFFHGLIISYADNTLYHKHRKLLGITHDKIPAISINNNEQKVVPYPEDQLFTVELMKKWLSKFVKGQLETKDSGFGSIIDAEIKYMMPDCLMITRHTFVDKVFEEGKDAIVFLYTSSVEDETQRMVAGKFNEAAQKFKQMKINSVTFYAYDVNVENQPPRIEQQEVPIIYFFPAYHKNPPYSKYLGQAKASEIAEFIKKKADIKFEMTIDLAQQEQFQEMRIKSMMEEQERKNSMKMIEDELKRRGEL
ncbi:UNKNOWN [Stylonychia lemnae]|uniref:protein disulfide-isomerase n=1 Tax=Stylonychia lemnae TaxID=5949 RepID=A0A078B8V5_STYLE|nr:UNKNOWN [Stylonychia lemnae]|eukprot:CDW90844.1 UNKNOWN [Stylonychia lemnae]